MTYCDGKIFSNEFQNFLLNNYFELFLEYLLQRRNVKIRNHFVQFFTRFAAVESSFNVLNIAHLMDTRADEKSLESVHVAKQAIGVQPVSDHQEPSPFAMSFVRKSKPGEQLGRLPNYSWLPSSCILDSSENRTLK